MTEIFHFRLDDPRPAWRESSEVEVKPEEDYNIDMLRSN